MKLLTSLMNIIMIVPILSQIMTSTSSVVETSGVIMTGPPSHGEYVFCWDGNIQIVLSGGLCNTEKIGIDPSAWGNSNSKDIYTMYGKILSHQIPITCGDYYNKYYIIATRGGCMISTNNKETIKTIVDLIPSNWAIMDIEKNTIISNTGLSTKPPLGFNLLTCMFFIFLLFTVFFGMLICLDK